MINYLRARSSGIRSSRAYRAARRVLQAYPPLYRPVGRALGNKQLVDSATSLVIEGFPRSANSFVEAAFAHSQDWDDSRIASHSHAPAQVLYAVKRAIPSIVLIRNPFDAVTSYLAMDGAGARVVPLFLDYAAFYRPLRKVVGSTLVVSFEEAIHDFSTIVAAVNQKFGVELVCPVVDDEFLAGVAARRDSISLARRGGLPTYSHTHDAGVLAKREELKTTIQRGFAGLRDHPAVRKAVEEYTFFTGQSGAGS